jgi:hypothetical protein
MIQRGSSNSSTMASGRSLILRMAAADWCRAIGTSTRVQALLVERVECGERSLRRSFVYVRDHDVENENAVVYFIGNGGCVCRSSCSVYCSADG